MKTVCIDVRMLHASGIGTYLQNLLPHFDKQFKLFLIGNEEEISALGLKNAEIISLDSRIYSLKEQYQLPFKVPSCDLFWTPHYNSPVLPVRSKKRVVTIHDVFHLRFFNTLTLSQKIYAKFFLSSSAKIADDIITVSHFSKKELMRYLQLPEKKINVIHNGVSERFQVINKSEVKNTFRLKYNLPEKFISFVGNVKPHKNIKNLVEAFALLKKENYLPDFKLVIAGKRKGLITGTENLDQLIEKSGLQSEVLFLEHLESLEMPLLYNLSSLLVFPSFYEGFGLPPLEAMACGCPTLVSDIECLKEIYGNETIYVSPHEPQDIKNGILQVLTDEKFRLTLIEQGKECAKKFTWESSANNHLYIFDKN